MTLADPNPPSGWPFRGLLTSSQMNLIRAGIMAAVDGVNGGVYTLLSKLTFAGTAMLEVGDKLQYTSRAVVRVIPMAPMWADAEWDGGVGGSVTAWKTTGTTSSQRLIVPLNLPHGATLDSVIVSYKGAAGHAAFPGGAPAVMPSIRVKTRSLVTEAETDIATVSDTSASAGAFEAAHNISATALATVVNGATTQYFISIVSESGANSIAGAYALGVTATCTITSQSEWTP